MSTPDILIIEEDKSLVRDTNSNAILNTDMSALEQYRAKRNKEREMLKKVEQFDELQSEVKEIKLLLQQLIAEKR
jgi:hypothetical protein